MTFPVIMAIVADHGGHATVFDALRAQAPVVAESWVCAQTQVGERLAVAHAPGGSAIVMCSREIDGLEQYNAGAGWAWNHGLAAAFRAGHRAALVMNDDIVLEDPRTLTVLRDIHLCCGKQLRYVKDRGFSAIVITREVWDLVGPFDEGFWPAYFEDNDYHRRCILAGVPYDDVQIPSEHWAGGSATIKTDHALNQWNATTFPLNRDRYYAKWGGGPGHEVYDVPWNGQPAQPSTRDVVSEEVRRGIERPW